MFYTESAFYTQSGPQSAARSPCFILTDIKAAGDKLLMNKFIRQKLGGGLMLKNVISCTFGGRFRLNLTESLVNGGSATRLLLV